MNIQDEIEFSKFLDNHESLGYKVTTANIPALRRVWERLRKAREFPVIKFDDKLHKDDIRFGQRFNK
jgi:hypothetical protein